MPQNKETFNIIPIQSSNSKAEALPLDPKSVPFSLLHELVKQKVRSIEDTMIYMLYDDFYVYLNPDRLHEINCLPQQARARVIKQTAYNIAYSNQVLIYSETAKDDI